MRCAVGCQASCQILGTGDRFRSRHARSPVACLRTVEVGADDDNAVSSPHVVWRSAAIGASITSFRDNACMIRRNRGGVFSRFRVGRIARPTSR
jgi:hypothetical protein